MTRILAWIHLTMIFFWELWKATWEMVKAIFSTTGDLRPAILAVPMDVRSDAAITLFANMVTLTPGTTSLDVSEDKRTLYVHCLDAPDPEATIREMKASLESAVMRALP
ncbi:MAG: Na+/H+ antiporter subunit E [Alphaproteobacteria bacterium]|nr:Na+/H+ antiporter subunit E [Alphaproteobacteria bacterium]MBU0799206.1 Na+/H+ antiporter subunit E [Alphaproteobacteria bacterium]MBU0887543.1 Na+/H+ antiporter subunit E [Alphaproteobacteria bacterium]MBU1814780.1 Na+/H+ antiporter subunit E [Alphaproteobacteria bacterium]MBU2089679.1 Na+/H+ antiporter subunit E [Alphaproteobacteria bacterium]